MMVNYGLWLVFQYEHDISPMTVLDIDHPFTINMKQREHVIIQEGWQHTGWETQGHREFTVRWHVPLR